MLETTKKFFLLSFSLVSGLLESKIKYSSTAEDWRCFSPGGEDLYSGRLFVSTELVPEILRIRSSKE